MTGVVLLPFTLVITLSGLIIAHLIYFPQATDAVLGQTSGPSETGMRAGPAAGQQRTGGDAGDAENTAERRFMAEGLGRARLPATGRTAGIASIDRMIASAERDWGVDGVYLVRVTHPGDAAGLVVLRRNSDDSVTRQIGNRRFHLATGEPLTSFEASTTANVWNFIGGMHYLQFSHWLLRWLYFLGGLGACAMIATGLLHWTQARNSSKRGPRANVALMNVLSIAAVTGIIAATVAFLLANRYLDNRARLAGIASRDLEVYLFYGIWLLSVLHASARVLQQRQRGHLQAWREQCWAIAAFAVAAVGLNWITTGDHLARTVFTDTYWPVAGVDLSLLLGAGIALWAARKLASHERSMPRSKPSPARHETDVGGARV